MKSLRYKIIYFFGPDGTGKTTHADLTALYLINNGCRVWRTSVKQHHMLSHLLLRLISSDQAMRYYGFGDELKQRIRTPWKFLEIISLLLAIFYRVLLPLSIGYVVICDRYVLDSLVTLSYFLKDSSLLDGWSAKLLSSLIPRNSLLFWMDGEVEILLSRKIDEPLTKELLEQYKDSYRKLVNILETKKLSVVHIDTTVSDLETTSVKVFEEISKKL